MEHNAENKFTTLLDKAVFVLSILFILTLTNSIFLNQIGYFGALICLLIRFFVTKKNPFPNTGLEIAFLLFIIAEFVSTSFSLDIEQSAFFTFKRLLLIPTLYVFSADVVDSKRAKQFVIIYISASTITLIYYLIKSFDYFVKDLYQVTASGPSVFQYPITSSELMSFSLVILFSFLINERSNWKNKLLIILLFTINLLALVATYKRTGWIGAAAGILLVVIFSRKWVLMLVIAFIGIVLIFTSRSTSQVKIYEFSDSDFRKVITLNTEGMAYSVLPQEDVFFISDYDNGLLLVQDTIVKKKYVLSSSVTDLKKWEDNFFVAKLADTRFVLLKFDADWNLVLEKEFYTAGLPLNHKVANGLFYVLDEDSSLVIYKSPYDISVKEYFSSKKDDGLSDFLIDSVNCVLIFKTGQFHIYSLRNYVPHILIIQDKLDANYELIYLNQNRLFIKSSRGLEVFSIDPRGLKLINSYSALKNINSIIEADSILYALTSDGKIFKFELLNKNEMVVKFLTQLETIPKSIKIDQNKFYTTFNKENRLFSFIDPHYSSNMTRLALWRAGIEIFKDHPWFGVGDIDLAKLYKQYKRPWDREIQGHLHNNYFHTLATLGGIGFAIFIFLLLKIFLTHVSLVKKLRGIPFAYSYSIGALGGYISFLAAGLTEYNFGDHEVITLVWFTLALSLAFAKSITPSEFQTNKS